MHNFLKLPAGLQILLALLSAAAIGAGLVILAR